MNNSQLPPVMTAPDIVVLGADPKPKDPVVAKLAADVDAYHRAVDGKDLDVAKVLRNQFVFSVMAEVDLRYNRYEAHFQTHRALAETSTDAALLGAAAATAVVSDAGIKDLLAAASVALNGTRLSAEKNFYNEQSSVALITQMRAMRSNLESQIITRCSTPVTSYTLEEAWKDLIKYTYAGNIQSALIQITSNAGTQNSAAQQKVDQAIANIVPATSADVANARRVTLIRDQLVAALTPPQGVPVDPTTQNLATTATLSILNAVQVPLPPNPTPADLADLLQEQFDNIQLDRTKMKTLYAATLAAPKIFGGTQ